jgi:hypothetical protein
MSASLGHVPPLREAVQLGEDDWGPSRPAFALSLRLSLPNVGESGASTEELSSPGGLSLSCPSLPDPLSLMICADTSAGKHSGLYGNLHPKGQRQNLEELPTIKRGLGETADLSFLLLQSPIYGPDERGTLPELSVAESTSLRLPLRNTPPPSGTTCTARSLMASKAVQATIGV